MSILPILLLASAPLAVFQDIGTAPQTECRTWQDCREQALAAAERQEYERFHDLAWRAVRLGPPEDPVLLTILARAQSRSGRPHDALVMLQRLAAKGVVTDAATSDDFRRVRGLPGWPELEARLTEMIAAGAAKLIPGEIAADPAVAGTSKPPTTPATRVVPGGDTSKEEAAAVRAPAAEAPLAGDAADVVRFTTFPFTPAGLAYDGVSSRFVVGDRLARRLIVVGERSQRMANLASAQSAGFGDITAFEIDPRQGDLWVISTAADADGPSSSLHKLQLTSGRALYSIGSATEQGPARFVDVAVTPRGTVLVLDGEGGRLFRLRSESRELRHATHLKVRAAASIAPASETVVYVAHATGVVRVDQGTGTVVPVGADRLDLSGLTWFRWHRRALVAIQAAGASYRVIRMALDRQGTRVANIAVLDRNVAMEDPTAATLWRDAVFYLADTPGTRGDGTVDIAVRRIDLK